MSRFPAVLVFSALLLLPAIADDAPYVPRAHAHNDYEHARPLLDALAQGFVSVEADIFLMEGQLLVAHDAVDLKAERTLEALYLQPLHERVKQNGGRVYAKAEAPFYLLIDIKTEAEPTYASLKPLLEKHRDMLSHFTDDKTTPGAVTVVISGNRPREIMAREKKRLAGIDGRLSDLEEENSVHLLPWISDNWLLHFRWRGDGQLPEEDQKKLTDIVRRTHERKQQLRFWGIPDTPAVWEAMRAGGVDWINSDKLEELSAFLRRR